MSARLAGARNRRWCISSSAYDEPRYYAFWVDEQGRYMGTGHVVPTPSEGWSDTPAEAWDKWEATLARWVQSAERSAEQMREALEAARRARAAHEGRKP